MAAGKTVPITIHEDGVSENDEAFDILLEVAAGQPTWVQVRNTDGTTECGTEGCRVGVIIRANGPPSVPRNLTAAPGDGTIRLEWQAPAITGGAAITEYRHRHAEGSSVPAGIAWVSVGTQLEATVR